MSWAPEGHEGFVPFCSHPPNDRDQTRAKHPGPGGDFTPGELLGCVAGRQGLDRRAFGFVSLSIPSATDPDAFARLTLVKIDADTPKVEDVTEQVGPSGRSQQSAGATGKDQQPAGSAGQPGP